MEFYSVILLFYSIPTMFAWYQIQKMSSDYPKLLDPGSSFYRNTLQGSRFRPFDCSTLCLWDLTVLGNEFHPDNEPKCSRFQTDISNPVEIS